MPKVTQQVGDRARPGIRHPNSQLRDHSTTSLCRESSSNVPIEETQCPYLGLKGVDVKLSLSPQVTFQKMPGTTSQGNLEACFFTHGPTYFSPPHTNWVRNSPAAQSLAQIPRGVGKPLPLSGPLFPHLGSEQLDRVICQALTVILWLSRSPAQSGHQHPFFLEGLRDSLWIQVHGISDRKSTRLNSSHT